MSSDSEHPEDFNVSTGSDVAAIHVAGLSFVVSRSEKVLLSDLNFALSTGSFVALIGPSGCGKSTLIRILAGMQEPTCGQILLSGHTASALQKQLPLALGFLPQFGAFHEELTVREILEYAAQLRLPGKVSRAERNQWLNQIAELSGVTPILDQRYRTLSGGQMRRIALAEELIGDPAFLFLDELTSGLDPHSEREMMAWLSSLARRTGKTILIVTHASNNLHYCDQVLFMHAGRLLFQGPPQELLPAFDAVDIEEVYSRAGEFVPVLPSSSPSPPSPQPLRSIRPPSTWDQLAPLFRRQLCLLLRDRGQFTLQLALLVTFPILVAIFATGGLPAVRNLSLEVNTNIVESLSDQLTYLRESFHVASLVSGLAMFQVILLALMGANNGAREIAKERRVLNKELRAGLSTAAYNTVKLVQVAVFSFVQSLWMTIFVKTVCGFPGDLSSQFVALLLPTLAMSATCLWFSAISRSPERASLLSIYLVGLQLPLSGAVLALPDLVTWLTRPFIAAYWGWSAYLKTLEPFRHYDVVAQSTDTRIAPFTHSIVLLVATILITHLLTAFAIHRGPKEFI